MQPDLRLNPGNRELVEVMPTRQTVSGQAIRYFRRWLPVRRSLLIWIREKAAIQAGGVLYGRTTKEKMGAFHEILADLFWLLRTGEGKELC